MRKIFFDKIPVLNVSDDVNDEFKVLVNDNTSVKIYRTKKLNNGSRVTGSAI